MKLPALPEAICSAFGLYSTLPLPQIEWSENSLRYTLAAFPLIGLVEGALLALLFALSHSFGFSALLFAAMSFALRFALTGGIHLDGFCDSADAVLSRQPREKQLEIMKDPHIGAMGAIALAALTAMELGLWAEFYENRNRSILLLLPLLFALLRSASGGSLLILEKARPGGLAQTVAAPSAPAQGRFLLGQALLYGMGVLCLGKLLGLALILALGTLFKLYLFFCERHFRGVTGDLAGAFFCLAQSLAMLILVVGGRL